MREKSLALIVPKQIAFRESASATEPRMRLYQFARPTRAATAGTLISRNSYPIFVCKAVVLYNVQTAPVKGRSHRVSVVYLCNNTSGREQGG
jgi:hypothetical protein